MSEDRRARQSTGWAGGTAPLPARPLEKIIAWDFERIVIAHGDLIEHDTKVLSCIASALA